MKRGKDKLLLLRGREDLIQVYRDTKRDEKQATNARANPIGWLEGWWGDELGPERSTSWCEKYWVIL